MAQVQTQMSFREALERFDEYIGNRLNAKSEKTRDAAQRALNVINTEVSELSVESRLRRTITNILSEIDEDEVLKDQELISDISPEKITPSSSNREEKIQFKKNFLSSYSDFKSMSSRGEGEKEVRLGNKDATASLSEMEIVDMLMKLGYSIQKEVLPGSPGAKSTKYKTYVISKPDRSSFSVVFGSANKGEKFEAELHKDLSSGAGPMGDKLLSAIGLSRSNVISIDPPLPARSRPLTLDISDVGKAISDITLNTSKGKMYISLKDPAGGTFSNNGYAGAFDVTPDGLVTANHRLDDFVSALGIDKEKIAQGVK